MNGLTVTNGSVTYGRVVKTGDFENKKCDITFGFSLEGANPEAATDEIGNLARRKCHELLELQKPLHAASASPVAPSNAKVAMAAAITGEKAAEPKPARAKKPPKVEAVDELDDEPTPKSAADKAMDQPHAGHDADDLPEDDFSAAPAEITDAELQDKVQKRNGVIKNSLGIRQLIGKYVTHPKGLKDVPQELRARFLTELEALQPAKA